jgi:hypothetical protein
MRTRVREVSIDMVFLTVTSADAEWRGLSVIGSRMRDVFGEEARV